jgi:predicted ferric reductase
MKATRIFWILVYFFSPLVIAGLILAARPASISNPAYVISVLLGAAPFVWLVNQFIISARPKFIERHFGMDNLYRFHGIMATISFGLGFLHSRVKEALTGMEPANGQIALILLGVMVVVGAVFLVDSFLRRFKPIEDFRKYLVGRWGLKRKVSVLLHNFTLVIVVLLLLHVLGSGAAFLSPVLRWTYIGYFALGMGFYAYHQFIRRWVMKKNAYHVVENQPEAKDVRTLTIVPRQGKVFEYKPGQFALITVVNGRVEKESHPFTIASSPSRPESISFSIKASGDFTSKLDQVAVGDGVRIDAPYGVFSYLLHPDEQELVFIAGGIGITPLLSMLRYMRDKDPQRKVTLLWGARTQDDLIRREEIGDFSQVMPLFQWLAILSNEPDWDGEKGFFDQEKLKRLALAGRDLSTTGFYICGPRIMMNLVAGELGVQGVPKEHIHFEKFAF